MVKLGQNFLVDANVLDVIERLAELAPEDVVLEIGGGPGILSERLVQRTAFVHVVEIDRGLEAGLRERLDGRDNVAVHVADALRLDLRGLDPPPNKLVANLPYSIAATAILRTIEQLEAVALWLVMVQREVGERLAAAPGSRAYGAPSVLAQLACEVKVLRPISRTVFRPAPRVDSVLLRLRRRGPGVAPGLRALVNDAFAHRRKTLAGSLALAAGRPGDVRGRVQDALRQLGHPADERAERLAPQEFAELARSLAR
jgi:16S rRNA (adenine1518-N6/adenine1519-N6)-dimethyltransferase